MKHNKCRGCQNCRHHSREYREYREYNTCEKAPKIKVDPIKGVTKQKVKCEDRNKRLTCPWFEEKDYKETYLLGDRVSVRLPTKSGNFLSVEATIMAKRDGYCMIDIIDNSTMVLDDTYSHEYYIPFNGLLVWVPQEDIEY